MTSCIQPLWVTKGDATRQGNAAMIKGKRRTPNRLKKQRGGGRSRHCLADAAARARNATASLPVTALKNRMETDHLS